jgi:prevent-host-death family protein
METRNTIDVNDASIHLSELLERVAAGEEFTITRHGAPVARLIPVNNPSTPEERRRAIERMLEISERCSLGGLKIKDLINEGRP